MNIAHTIRTHLNHIVEQWNGSLQQPAVKTYGIPWFNNVFNGTDYNNIHVIQEIVDCRRQEEELILFLQQDEIALRLLMNAELDTIDHKKDGILTIDANLKVHYRYFPLYNYQDQHLYSPLEDIYGHIVVLDRENDEWYVLENYADYAIKYLSERVPDFPVCADLVVVDHELKPTINELQILFKCKLCSKKQPMTVRWDIPLYQLYDEQLMIISQLLFGQFYCNHIDGDAPKNYHSTVSDTMQIHQVGNMFSAIKTYTRWLADTPPASLLSCTSKRVMIYGQCQYMVRKHREAALFGDIYDNIAYLKYHSTNIELELLQIPPCQEANQYFGFCHYFNQIPGTMSLYSPTKSHIIFRNATNIYLDATGLLIGPTKFKWSTDAQTWYNFFMSTDSPFGGVQGITLLDYCSTSKSSESMYMALTQYGCSYNKFWGYRAGRIHLEHKYFSHTDCDRATSNAVCQWGNGIDVYEYVSQIWDNWFLYKLSIFLMVLVWCWPHITGFIGRNDNHYKHLPKKIHKKMKHLSLWFMKLLKLCLAIIPLMCIVNVLHLYLTTQTITIDQPIDCDEIKKNDLKNAIPKEKDNDSDHGLFKCVSSKKQQAQFAADANQSLEEIEGQLVDDFKDDNNYTLGAGTTGSVHYWKPYPSHPEVVVYYIDGNDFISDNVSRFPVPITRDGQDINIETFCPPQWTYLLSTIALAPLFCDMETGGARKASNINSEVLIRGFKFIEGLKNLALDIYVNHMFAIYLGYTAQWLIRVREQIAKRFKNMSFLKEMWNGRNHKQPATSAFDICTIRHFSKLCQFEKSLNLNMGKNKLWTHLKLLINITTFTNEYNLKYISKSMMYCFKHFKALNYTKSFYINIQIYLTLWIRDRLQNIHSYDVESDNTLNIDGIEEFVDKSINDCNEAMSNDEQ